MEQPALFAELLHENYGRWRAIARSYAGQDDEDLFQEILLQIWRSLGTFRGAATKNTWCYRIALNTALSWRRSERTRCARLPIQENVNPALVSSAETPSAADELVQHLLAQLEPTDRALLLLFLDDVGYGDMAEILGTTEGSVRVRMHRLKKRLTELHEEQSDESR